MKLDLSSNSLFTSDGKLIKQFSCPLRKQWGELSLTASVVTRFCSSCDKNVIDLTEFGEEQIIAIFKVNPEACAYIDFHRTEVEFEFIDTEGKEGKDAQCLGRNHSNLVVIKTARDIASMNRAEKQGYKLLIKPTNSEKALASKVILRKDNGIYSYGGFDYRSLDYFDSVISSEKANLNSSPFAAYLIPRNLPKSTRVFIPDVIEHIVESSWNQDVESRLESSEGLWDGEDIVLDPVEVIEMLG
ncbi:hypothetical protein [Vibrio breoganii]|uniref:hypothetical protein n=1 Tax=Vibrio breoganii TaxID=553239 RepID=UPI0021C48533|nr:hypothetical protein [Vibrio breoganii]MDN3717774.1 hypothetical protein [Vibrio breoganii]